MTSGNCRSAAGTAALLLLAVAGPASAQSPSRSTLVTELIAIEQRAWESWKTKNSAFYRTTLLDSAVYLGGTGTNTREQIAKQVDDLPCSVDQFTLENPSAVMLGRDAALLTVKSTMTLTCPNGAPSTSSAWGSTVFVRKDGVWRIAFHQESTIKPPKK